jgi:hypothetical protein
MARLPIACYQGRALNVFDIAAQCVRFFPANFCAVGEADSFPETTTSSPTIQRGCFSMRCKAKAFKLATNLLVAIMESNKTHR